MDAKRPVCGSRWGTAHAWARAATGVPWTSDTHFVDGYAALGCYSFALLTVRATAGDPRWTERTANPADNRAVVDFLTAAAAPGDVVLLDMTTATNGRGRQSFWINHGVSSVPTIAWVRHSPALALDEQLGRWLQPYSRIWLVMQETVENAPDSTTEQWLDQYAYRGRQQWIGSQRLVEYLTASQLAPLAAVTSPNAFSNAAVLQKAIRCGRGWTHLYAY